MKDFSESGKNSFVLKKSYEISYALWRIAANMNEGSYADILFERALELIDLAAEGRYGKILKRIEGLETIIRFGGDTNTISIQNAGILMKEIETLKSAIPLERSGKKEDVYIADIFEPIFEVGEEEEMPPAEEIREAFENDVKATGNIKAEERQAAILERIRQIGNCRLNDIQVILPDISERTIRYDLESLVQRGLVERIGTGGRSVYYRVKQL